MNDKWKGWVSEAAKAVGPTAGVALWGYFVWKDLQHKLGILSPVAWIAPLLVVLLFAAVDIFLSVRRGISIAIATAYAAFALVSLVTILVGPDAFVSDPLVGVFLLASFLTIRLAAQVLVTPSWHWSVERPRTGMAVTSVLFIDDGEQPASFVLIKNTRLNQGHGLWVSPGGRWDPALADPEERLREKIATEVNLRMNVVQPSAIPSEFNDLQEMDNQDCKWFLPPHMLLYENLGVKDGEFPQYHLDLIYLCASDGTGAGKSPKYAVGSGQIRVLVSDCEANFHAAHASVTKAADEMHLQMTGQKRGRKNDVADDVVWRLHIAAKMLRRKP